MAQLLDSLISHFSLQFNNFLHPSRTWSASGFFIPPTSIRPSKPSIIFTSKLATNVLQSGLLTKLPPGAAVQMMDCGTNYIFQ